MFLLNSFTFLLLLLQKIEKEVLNIGLIRMNILILDAM